MNYPITENKVYLWPRERMLIGAIIGNYQYPIDDKYTDGMNLAARAARSRLKEKPLEIEIPRDILYDELVEYTRRNFSEILDQAEISGLPAYD